MDPLQTLRGPTPEEQEAHFAELNKQHNYGGARDVTAELAANIMPQLQALRGVSPTVQAIGSGLGAAKSLTELGQSIKGEQNPFLEKLDREYQAKYLKDIESRKRTEEIDTWKKRLRPRGASGRFTKPNLDLF